jgi:hypothetical protein
MHDQEKSDSAIVAVKPSNKAGVPANRLANGANRPCADVPAIGLATCPTGAT